MNQIRLRSTFGRFRLEEHPLLILVSDYDNKEQDVKKIMGISLRLARACLIAQQEGHTTRGWLLQPPLVLLHVNWTPLSSSSNPVNSS